MSIDKAFVNLDDSGTDSGPSSGGSDPSPTTTSDPTPPSDPAPSSGSGTIFQGPGSINQDDRVLLGEWEEPKAIPRHDVFSTNGVHFDSEQPAVPNNIEALPPVIEEPTDINSVSTHETPGNEVGGVTHENMMVPNHEVETTQPTHEPIDDSWVNTITNDDIDHSHPGNNSLSM